MTFVLALLSQAAYAQTVQVSGMVVDENELPVIGAAVVVKGTDVGTVTDENGRFSFGALSPEAVLEASALGYASASSKVNGEGLTRIILREDVTYLDELVVVGYGVQKKSDLTGAISSINAQETMKKMQLSFSFFHHGAL